MRTKILCGLTLVAIGGAFACGKNNTPVSPSVAVAGDPSANPDGSNLKIDSPRLVSPVNGFQPNPGSTTPINFTWNNVSGRYASFPVTYELQILNAAGTSVIASQKVPAQSGATTSFSFPVAQLAPDTPFMWKVRATYQNANGPLSSGNTFRTAIPAIIFDSLTNGTTTGVRLGGHFVIGQGWVSDSFSDGIYWDLPTPCTNCTLDFDIATTGKGLGNPNDMKFITMGDAPEFDNFTTFRDHDWKMHLEQRADGDGTGMKLIWRNGDSGGGEPGDHTGKADPAIRWDDTKSYHFTLSWSPSGFSIRIDGELWFQDGFGGNAYAPPHHRISLGCYPRNETLKGTTWRNVRLLKN